VNLTAAQNVAKEALEESGFEVEPLKLAAVWDHTKQGHARTSSPAANSSSSVR
jgi:ADP-ribose pyrophosphatase YjhB (NUDIX family)